MKNNIKYSVNILGLALLLLFAPVNAISQQEEVQLILRQIKSNLESSPYSMKIEYEELKRGKESFVKMDECMIYEKGNSQRVVFKTYETLISDKLYIKVDHISKELYILKAEKESKKLNNSWNMSEENLTQFQLKLDTISTSAEKGLVSYIGSGMYSKIEFVYDSASLLPISYTVFYTEKGDEEIASIRTKFKQISKEKFDFSILNSEAFFVTKNNQVELIPEYQNYKLIKNF